MSFLKIEVKNFKTSAGRAYRLTAHDCRIAVIICAVELCRCFQGRGQLFHLSEKVSLIGGPAPQFPGMIPNRTMFALRIPVRAYDFSQSAVDGLLAGVTEKLDSP